MQISKMLRLAIVLGLLLAVAAIGAVIAVSAQQKPRVVRNTGGLTVEEYIEITQLYGLYTRDIDPGARRDATWTFTSDGGIVMDRSPNGEKELKEYYDNVLKRAQNNGTRHMTTTYVIVGMPDGTVRGSAYNLGVQRLAEGKPLTFQAMGKYEDFLVKTKEGWRFKKRVSVSDTFIGSDKVLPPSPMPGVPEAPWEYKR